MTGREALKLCPFCGGEPEWASRKPYLVNCADPDCLGHQYEQDEQGGYNHSFYTEAEAIAAWHTRVSHDELVEALERLVNFYADFRSVPDGYEIKPADEQTNEHIASAMRLLSHARSTDRGDER